MGPIPVPTGGGYRGVVTERTLYEILMLHPTATLEVINAVYRQLAKRHHPDHAGPTGQRRMAEINEAYAILSHPEKRAGYDEMLGLDRQGVTKGFARPSAPGATNLKYDSGVWSVRDPAEPTPASAPYGEAGPPPAFPRPRGSILSFGRYRGWAISQVATQDRNYLEWLSRTMAGKTYRSELDQVLRQTSS
jgi:curved DNA-binding protein CbpA